MILKTCISNMLCISLNVFSSSKLGTVYKDSLELYPLKMTIKIYPSILEIQTHSPIRLAFKQTNKQKNALYVIDGNHSDAGEGQGLGKAMGYTSCAFLMHKPLFPVVNCF